MKEIVYFIFAVAGILQAVHSHPAVSPLQCNFCFSTTSWADCLKHAVQVTCSHDPGTCCVEFHRTFKRGLQEVHQFAKSCFHDSVCQQRQCLRTSLKWDKVLCDFRCCSTTLCNDQYGMTSTKVRLTGRKRKSWGSLPIGSFVRNDRHANKIGTERSGIPNDGVTWEVTKKESVTGWPANGMTASFPESGADND